MEISYSEKIEEMGINTAGILVYIFQKTKTFYHLHFSVLNQNAFFCIVSKRIK